MKTVFFGSPAAALPSLEAVLAAGHTVELVVTQPDKPAGRGRRLTPSPVKALALEKGLPVIEPARIRTDAAALERITAARPDVNLVVAYGQIIPRAVHYFPPYHSLNVHFSLLPKYRGAAPVQWTVLNGDAETGVSVIELDDRMDEGDILAVERTPVGPRETAAALEDRLAVLGARLLVTTLSRIDTVPHLRQNHALATLAPKVRKEDGRLDWARPADEIDRRVLALADRPGTYTSVQGRRMNVLQGQALGSIEGYWPIRPLDRQGAVRRMVRGTAGRAQAMAAPPGTVIWIDKPGLDVACGDGTAFLIEKVRPEGKGDMTAHAFSLGAKLSPGDLLGE
ncbi:MAG: methionyl-tRNA formyltransferase [Acidobacteria bacterium]|nr:methionyl-tRNA formyltransferase [Acidobacteriota bacterium]